MRNRVGTYLLLGLCVALGWGCASSLRGGHPPPPAQGHEAQAEEALRRWVAAPDTGGGGRVIDAYLRATSSDNLDPALLVDAYERLFSTAATWEAEARAPEMRHLALSELLYAPGSPQEARSLTERAEEAWRWWVKQDVTPADPGNQRLLTHLRRVQRAREQYADERSSTGLDARGETYVRYGEPSRKRTVRFERSPALRALRRDGLAVSHADFPDNEMWTYDHIHDAGFFLFVRPTRSEPFRIGTTNDLIPRHLRNRGLAGSARSAAYAIAALTAMRFAHQELALFHPSFALRADALGDVVSWHEERAIGSRLGGRGAAAVAGYETLERTLERALGRSSREDEDLARRREQALPADFAPAPARAGQPLRALAARFRAEDGRTEALVAWDASAYDREMCQGLTHHWARVAVPQGHAPLVVGEVAGGQGRRALSVPVPPEGYPRGLAIQVDLLPSRGRGGCTGTAWLDELRPLELREQGFAMSDFLPFEVEDVLATQAALAASEFSPDAMTPFLRPNLRGQEALGIYFEVYALTDLAGDYVLEYEVVRRTRGGILRRGTAQSSVYQARRTLADGRLPAAFLIDRGEWEGADEVEVVVTVTHTGTGAVVERSLRLSTGR